MTDLRKYRQTAAAILLALYCFIATPVQFWHHHATKSGVSADKEQSLFSSAAANSIGEDNCPVCAHKYSIYGEELAVFTESPFEFIKSINSFFSAAVPSCPRFSFSNKGPPFPF